MVVLSHVLFTVEKTVFLISRDDKQKLRLRLKKRFSKRFCAGNVVSGTVNSATEVVGGTIHGVTGVFTKPIEGARDDGLQGFAVGVGKVRKRLSLLRCHFILKLVILPRQARDKHRASTQKQCSVSEGADGSNHAGKKTAFLSHLYIKMLKCSYTKTGLGQT